MKWENMHGVEIVAQRRWLCKKDAACFFARLSHTNRMYPDVIRLQQAVDEGKIKTKVKGTRTLYNMWDCMQNCRIL